MDIGFTRKEYDAALDNGDFTEELFTGYKRRNSTVKYRWSIGGVTFTTEDVDEYSKIVGIRSRARTKTLVGN